MICSGCLSNTHCHHARCKKRHDVLFVIFHTRDFLSFRIDNVLSINELFYKQRCSRLNKCKILSEFAKRLDMLQGELRGFDGSRRDSEVMSLMSVRHSSRETQPLKTYLSKRHSILALILLNANIQHSCFSHWEGKA